MVTYQLLPVDTNEIPLLKSIAQEAFQKGVESKFGTTEETILPESDIDKTLEAPGAIAYKLIDDNHKLLGGAIVTLNYQTKENHLDFLFLAPNAQGKGLGKYIWKQLERLHSDAKTWETMTPYFDQRNIHFYVNHCGFSIVEFFNEKHPMPDSPEEFIGDNGDGMFRFIKHMI